MMAGKLDRWVDLLGPSTEENDLGERTGEPVVIATVPASYRPMRGRDLQVSGKTAAEAWDIWTIRHRDDISTANTLRNNGAVYEIVRVAEIGRRQALELTTRKVS